MSKEKCQRCGEIGQDRRTLWMACLYDMSELGLPFVERNMSFPNSESTTPCFTLIVCKDCRALWMQTIKVWFEDSEIKLPTSNYPRRFLGTNT